MDQELFRRFLWFISERESIRRKKELGDPWPWTKDPILQRYKFTNIWRQDDRTTRALHARLQECESDREALLNIFAFRLVNRASEIERLPIIRCAKTEDWAPGHIRWGDAFIILPALPRGTEKRHELLSLLSELRDELGALSVNELFHHETVRRVLRRKRISGLVLYEMMLDWWQYRGEPEAYVHIGPGALPMLRKLYPDARTVGVDRIEELTNILNGTYGIRHEKHGLLTWRCIEGALCEFRKYMNLTNDPKARKRLYVYRDPKQE